jgi:eukaryotic-like serine/threonine-protein kinase
MPLTTGTKLGPYEIISPLGAGGMGEVYRARDSRLHRDVAIKVSAAQFSERFEREAQAIAALNHPNICTLYDIGPNYLVMEFIEGTPLKGPLPLDQSLRYAIQICDALDAAHKKNITHRDLKPANILVTASGVKLLDFGLAKIETPQISDGATQTFPLTEVGLVMGTTKSNFAAAGCDVDSLIATGTKTRAGQSHLATEPAVCAYIFALPRDEIPHTLSHREIPRRQWPSR